MLGWIVKAPSDDQCPTSHRYLRSPVEGSSCYLGGPISLANRDPVDRVCVQLSKERNMAIVTSKPGRRMVPGGEILWSYKLAEKCEIKMYAAEDWFHEVNIVVTLPWHKNHVTHYQPSVLFTAPLSYCDFIFHSFAGQLLSSGDVA